jgi:peptide/histidine transporter 3/4
MTPFVIVVALERFTYYSLVVNLFIFFYYDVYQHEEKSNGPFNGPTDAIVSVMVLIGLSWMFCVLGGWISDARLGKLKTIIWGLVIYVLGTGLLLLSAYLVKHQLIYKKKKSYRPLVVFASILVALIGEGAYKANIAAFGAEQLDHKDPVSTRRYFNFYYFSLNIGVLFALSISAYIQQWKGFIIGFALPFGSITLALIIFVLSRKRYKILPCQRIVGKAYQIIKEARRKRKRSSRR